MRTKSKYMFNKVNESKIVSLEDPLVFIPLFTERKLTTSWSMSSFYALVMVEY
jgi:hypothetical protein